MKYSRAFLLLAAVLFQFPVGAAEYDPLQVPEQADVRTTDLTVRDAKRKREIPIRVYLPAGSPLTPGSSPPEPGARGDTNSRGAKPLPVVIFSHGLGGNREGSAFLGKHWAGRGYAAVFLQHPGSDEAVWKNERPLQRMAAMKKAASPENFLLRVADVPAVLDQLEIWNRAADDDLAGRLDVEHVGMSGHSFGAMTTQGVSGQTAPLVGQRFSDKRIQAAVIMSPGIPRRGDPKTVFAEVKIPWLLMTGTNDTAAIGGQTVESRLAVFPVLPEGEKYELVLDGAEHSAFTERALPGDKQQRNPNHHRAILALSTAFWDAYLRKDDAAKAWLDGDGPRGVLEKADRWQKK